MEIITTYGSIYYDDLDEFDLSKETLEYVERKKTAAEIFFAGEIDLTDDDKDFKDEIQELAEVAIAENKFSEPSKAFALAENQDAELTDIEEVSYTSSGYEIGGAEFVVFNEEEADEAALEYAKNLIDDIGINHLNNQEYIYSNFVETEWFDNAMEEYNSSYAYEMESETSSDADTYVSRLHEEMVERGIMDEPEWPEVDDFEHEREDYDAEEPDPEDYSEEDQDQYEEDAQEWADGEVDWENEQDRLEEEAEENYENARSEYEDKLTDEVSNKIDDFAQAMNGDYEDGIDYWKQNMGEEDVARVAAEQGLVDHDAVAEWLVDEDGRGSLLSGYDGTEDYIEIIYRGGKFEYYIYRVG